MELTTSSADRGKRLDHFLQAQLPEYSRARLQDWIKAGRVKVNGAEVKPSYELRGEESIVVEPAQLPPLKAEAEEIPLRVLYCDDAVIAVDKPAGMVVHSGAGQTSGTLVNALLHHFQTLSTVSGDDRPGIVHRIDKETSGVLLVARTDSAHRALQDQFSGRTVEKTYLALVQGVVKQDHGTIRTPIARDPVRRIRMTTRLEHGREAFTEYWVRQRFAKFTFLEIRIGTGRTHQIRVHMASIGHPVAGDKLYGAAAGPLDRFFLHAHRIRFVSPATGEQVTVESALPRELETWMVSLNL